MYEINWFLVIGMAVLALLIYAYCYASMAVSVVRLIPHLHGEYDIARAMLSCLAVGLGWLMAIHSLDLFLKQTVLVGLLGTIGLLVTSRPTSNSVTS